MRLLKACQKLVFVFAAFMSAIAFAGDEPTKFKGLWIGMNLQDVPAILKQHLPPHFIMNEKGRLDGSYVVDVLAYTGTAVKDSGTIVATAEKKVSDIRFGPDVCDILFKTGKMTDDEIMRGMSEGYGLIRWQLERLESNLWNVARTKTGERVAFLRSRGAVLLWISKDPLASGGKSNFN